MSIYVDPLFAHSRRNSEGYFWSHMAADSISELHDFASLIGRKRCWFHRNHYDLTPSFRDLAIVHGAIEVSSREMSRFLLDHYPRR